MASTGDEPTAAAWTCSTCGERYPADYAMCPRDATPRTRTTAPHEDAMLGVVLGHTYKITRALGAGGMARLYEADHLRIDERFAIKIIHDDLAREPDMIARFEREARAAGRIRSEHVVRLIDVLRTTDGRPCLVTELLEGEDLQVRLDRDNKLSVADALSITRQLCRAVADAHAVGVVHRDLKPSNVFLCKTEGAPFVKVLDFGVAKLEDDERLTRTDAVMGTAAYMAPEQARRAVDAGPLADVYSLGAVLYHVLTGQPPYGNVPAISRFALVLHEEPARPRAIEPSVPEGVEAVIQRAMARDPATRIQSVLALEAELAAFEAPAPAPPVARVSRRATTVAATEITLRARFARPLAAVIAVASSIAAGAWAAALLGAAIGPASRGERTLIGLVALIALGTVSALHLRKLRPSWGSAPAVTSHVAAPARALIVGMIAFGALELVEYASEVVFHDELLGIGARLVLTGVAAGVALGWRSLGLHDRLMRRIG